MPRRASGRSRGKPRKVESSGERTVRQQTLRRSSLTFPRSLDALGRRTRKDLLDLARREGLRGLSRLKKKALARALWRLLKRPAPQTETSSPPDLFNWESAPLLEGDAEDRLVLMPIDPYWVHAYWEMRPQSAPELSRRILRVYDVTFIDFDGTNAHSSFDIEITPEARNWYINVWSPGKSLCADLGLIHRDGTFSPLVRSNVIQTPPAWASPNREEHWMRVEWGGGDLKHGRSLATFEVVEPVPRFGLPQPSSPQEHSPHPGIEAPDIPLHPKEAVLAEEYRRFLEATLRMGIHGMDDPVPPILGPPPAEQRVGAPGTGLSSVALVKKR